MRLILILLIAAIAFGVVQGMRHGCKFAFDRATYDCIMHGRPVRDDPGGHRSASSGPRASSGTCSGACTAIGSIQRRS